MHVQKFRTNRPDSGRLRCAYSRPLINLGQGHLHLSSQKLHRGPCDHPDFLRTHQQRFDRVDAHLGLHCVRSQQNILLADVHGGFVASADLCDDATY